MKRLFSLDCTKGRNPLVEPVRGPYSDQLLVDHLMDPKKEYKGGPTIGLLHCDLDFSKFNAKVNKDRSNMRLVVREFIFDPKSSIEISFSVILGVLAIISVLLMMAESVDEE